MLKKSGSSCNPLKFLVWMQVSHCVLYQPFYKGRLFSMVQIGRLLLELGLDKPHAATGLSTAS